MQTGMSIQVTGRMIKHMALGDMSMKTGQFMMGNGSTISSMEKEWRDGLTTLSMKAAIMKDTSTAKGSSAGLTEATTRDSSHST